ncbi:hypothetical protein ACFL2Q_11665 [Thermodesulfobacteriota bacterium]
MSFLSEFFGKAHPSTRWQEIPDFPVLLDLSRHSLCNFRIGDPVDWFSGLGPPEDPKGGRLGNYTYFSKGLEVYAEKGAVEGFAVIFLDDSRPEFGPFPGEILYDGRALELGHAAGETGLTEIFGKPYWRDQDEQEAILFYEWIGDIEWQVEFSLDNFLKCILITSPPLLSRPAQRKAYGVTKPWPP